MTEDDKSTSSWYKVPAWNGHPAEWRSFKREMSWWIASLDAESCKKYNVAARWALRQSGVVRARCEEFDPSELEGSKEEKATDPDTGESYTVQEADPFAGLRKLMKALEESMGKTELDRKGELRAQFYQEIKRNPGERISAFCTRFRTLTSELKREGINLPDAELGWFLKDRLGLDALRRQLLDTALGGKETYTEVEAEILRLFRDLHTADPLHRRVEQCPPLLQRFLSGSSGSHRTSAPSSNASQTTSFKSRFSTTSSTRSAPRPFYKQPQRQAMVAEGQHEFEDEPAPEDEEELIPVENETNETNLESLLQTEAEILAAELQSLEEDGEIDPGVIDELEAGVEGAAEALVTMREARSRISEMKRDRGYGKTGGGKGKPGHQAKGRSNASKKVGSMCWDCGDYGHWQGDPQCQKPGQGLFRPNKGKGNAGPSPKQVLISEANNTEHAVQAVENEVSVSEVIPVHDVLVMTKEINTLSAALDFAHDVQASQQIQLASDKMLVGALDSACNRTVCGELWMNSYLEKVRSTAPVDVQELIAEVPESEVFRFGNGGTKTSFSKIRIPIMVGKTLVLVWVSIVSVPSLGLLLGRDFMDAIGAVISFARKILRADYLDGSLVRLKQLVAGHFAVELAPSSWPSPGPHRWRKSGLAGVVELQVKPIVWFKRKIDVLEVGHRKPEHEHLVTEWSVQAADVSHSGLHVDDQHASQLSAHRAQAMSSSEVLQHPTTTSPLSSCPPSTLTSPSSSSLKASLRKPSSTRAKRNANIPSPTKLPKMASTVPASGRQSKMACARPAVMAITAAILALCAIPLSQHQNHRPMEIAGRADGVRTSPFQKALGAGQEQTGLHRQEPSRADMVSKSSWTSGSIHGGRSSQRNVGGPIQPRHKSAAQESCLGRSTKGSCSNHRRGQERRVPSSADRTSRRAPNLESGSSPLGSLVGSHSGSQSHRRRDQRTMWSSGEEANGSKQTKDQVRPRRPTSQSSSGVSARGSASDSKSKPRFHDALTNSCTNRDLHARSSRASSATRSMFPRHDVPGDAARGKHSGQSSSSKASHRHSDISRTSPGDDRKSVASGLHGGRTHADADRSPTRHEGGTFRDAARSSTVPVRPGRLRFRPILNGQDGDASPVEDMNNPYKIHQTVKPGVGQLIAQAWQQHERDQKLISVSKKDVQDVFQAEWTDLMDKALNETFVTTIRFPEKPLMQEIFTASQRVTHEAESRGHQAGPALSLETGWDFIRAIDRAAAIKWVKKHKPFFLVLAFPCGPWSPLMRLNPAHDLAEKQEVGLELIRFAIELSEIQLEGKRHFLMENPTPSSCWKLPEMIKFLEEHFVHLARFDQCRFDLKSATGNFHRKSTTIATSSQEMKDALDGVKCLRDHSHQPVLGGPAITQRAGHYPQKLAAAMVNGMENEFHKQFSRKSKHEALAVEGDGVDDDGAETPGPMGYESSDSEEVENWRAEPGKEDVHLRADPSMKDDHSPSFSSKIPAAIKMAVKRLHETTGHRSNRRLARALVLSGAPQQVIEAAKKHKCSVCDERKSPKPRRPASLPTPKDVSDQVHIDIFEVHDAREEKSYVVHMVDYASRLQMAKLLPDKSTESVVSFLKEHWFPVMGPPRVLVADQGKEFVSWRFEEACSEHSILLWHCAIQAPWQNGICERSGGILKVLIGAIVRSKSVLGKQEMQWAVQEAVTAYNQDINEYGVSPLQAAFGRQPRMQGDILGDFGNTLAEHGLIDNKPSLARQLALREVAKVAMARLHFSQSLRKALLAQSKTTTQTHDLQPGQVVYYYRFTKYNNKTEPARRKLSLRRWHGPALLIAFDGHANCFVSHRGQVAKVALEHLRPASTMEQVAHGVWRDSIEDIVEESIRSITEQGAQVEPSQPQAVEAPQNVPDRAISTTSHTEPTDLPEVQPQELIQAAADAQAGDGSVPDESRRTSLLTAMPGTPVASLLRRPSAISARMEQAIGRAQDLARSSAADEVPVPPDDGWQGQKRQAEVPLDELQEQTRAEEEPTPFPAPPPVDGFEVFEMTHQEMTMCSDPGASHPLRLLCQQVAKDRKNPLETFVEDHGTWKGYWPLPSRSEWQAVLSVGGMWPKGEHEALAATARREYKWKEIPMNDRPQFVEAAKTGWQVWVDNDAVQILDDKEAAATWKRLEATGKKHLVLTPRFVFTDKHDGLRTENVKLPLKANARLVVPGYKDMSAYDVRKDAPTGGRISQHLLLLFTASHSWTLASADVKSAFLKGEEFQPGERELYITNIRVLSSDEPTLPLGRQGLARLRKGIFGLSDSPRRWYLRLHKSLVRLGWVRSEIDAALWYLWGPDRQLRGMVLSHVDDLLIGGDEVAMESIKKLGEELGFGSLEFGKFTYCGKTFEQHPDKSISISMQSYHDNMKLVKIPVDRRRNPEAALTPSEQKSLRGVLGSLQWLVAQVRIDMSYPLSVLQGESPTVSTLLKANSLVKRFKQSSEFALWFRPMKLDGCGLIGVSDASLGNTMKSGGVGMDPMVRVYSQCGYLMLIGDSDMMSGREGHFALLDGRSHRLSRVCRSTYAAELLSAEETFDVGQYCRGVLAEALGYPMNQRDVSACCDAVPLTVVVDAKDVFDKSTSDTPSYGSQKSLAFSVAWLRNLLRRPNCNIRWTATANMLADALTKDMDAEHLRKVLTCGKWCTRYSPQFVKQTGGQKRNSTTVDRVTVGKPLELDDPMFGRLLTLSESPGWHFEDDIPILVAKAAKSFRTPEPRFDSKEFNRRTSFGRFDTGNGSSEWRELERDVDWGTRKHALIGQDCSCLITCFRRSSQANKESRSTVEESICHG